MSRDIVFTDGRKSVLFDQYKPSSWTWLSGGPDDGVEVTTAEYFKTVPWLYRGVGLRANAVASLPFDLVKDGSEEVLDTSEDWQNILEFIPNPYKMFWLMEASQVLSGRSYQFKISNDAKTFELKYIRPTSINPVIDEKDGLTGFKRNTGQATIEYPYNPDNPLSNKILYYWLDDPNVEIGEPEAYPAKAALSATGVLFSVDEFLGAFISRGMVKPTLIGLKGNPPQAEKDKTEAWFNKYLTGIKNAFRVKTVSADAVDIITIGEGLAELGSTELTAEKRQDVSTALGIPLTILFSEGAGGLGGGGVVEQDDMRFYTTTVIPAWKGLAYELNRQFLIPLGYRIVEKHERLPMFQEDEKDASAAMVNLTSAVATDPKAAKFSTIVLGMEIPEDAAKLLEEMIKQKDEDREKMAEMGPPQPIGGNGGPSTPAAPDLSPKRDTEDKMLISDLGKWQRKAKKALERGKDAVCPFDSKHITAELNSDIMSMLAEAKTAADITTIFEMAKHEQATDPGDFDDVIRALDDATKALQEEPPPPAPVNVSVSLPQTDVHVEAAKAAEIQPVINVQPADTPVTVSVNPTPVVIENEINIPEPTPKTTTVTRDAEGNIEELTTE